MRAKTKDLSNRELQMLSMLSKGDTYQEIAEHFGIALSNVHAHCYNIRHKTGIRETRDERQCLRYLRTLSPARVTDALNPPSPRRSTKSVTIRQMEVLRFLALGRSYAQIGQILDISPQTAQNTACEGCKRAGITHAGWNRTKYLREWLRRHDGEAPPCPMDDPAF